MTEIMAKILSRVGERKKLPPRVFAFYSGKLVDMDYIPDPKRRFAFAGMRISDNAGNGYVLAGDKVYAISRSSRMAKLLTGEAREAALAEIADGEVS